MVVRTLASLLTKISNSQVQVRSVFIVYPCNDRYIVLFCLIIFVPVQYAVELCCLVVACMIALRNKSTRQQHCFYVFTNLRTPLQSYFKQPIVTLGRKCSSTQPYRSSVDVTIGYCCISFRGLEKEVIMATFKKLLRLASVSSPLLYKSTILLKPFYIHFRSHKYRQAVRIMTQTCQILESISIERGTNGGAATGFVI